MAFGTLPRPGTELGPCANPCSHTDCAQSRQMAETVCRVCTTPIGYDAKMCFDSVGSLVHYLCILEETEARHKGGAQ